jgi:hypothetical protein
LRLNFYGFWDFFLLVFKFFTLFIIFGAKRDKQLRNYPVGNRGANNGVMKKINPIGRI